MFEGHIDGYLLSMWSKVDKLSWERFPEEGISCSDDDATFHDDDAIRYV